MKEQELRDELRNLRRGRGATAVRLMASPLVYELLGSPADSANAVVDAFGSLLEPLGGSIQARALRNAYGLGMKDPGNLTKRRNNFAVSGGDREYHTDTVENWENQSIDELIKLTPMPEAEGGDTPDHKLDRIIDWWSEEFDVLLLRLKIEAQEREAYRESSKEDPWLQDWIIRNGIEAGKLSEAQQELFHKLDEWKQQGHEQNARMAKIVGRYLAVRELGYLLGEMSEDYMKSDDYQRLEREWE